MFYDKHDECIVIKVLEKLQKNDGELKEVNLNNICGISEQLFCDIFNALKNNDKCVKFSACNCDVRLIIQIQFSMITLCILSHFIPSLLLPNI